MIDIKLQSSADLARLVKNARTQRGATQQDVADAVGITRQSLARIEQGHGGVSFNTVLRILDHLGISLESAPEHRLHSPVELGTTSAAQAASAALAKRVDPLVTSRALEALHKRILSQLDPATRPTFDVARALQRVEASVDPATLASIRDASRGLTESLAIPGSVLRTPPRGVDGEATRATTPESDADKNAAEDAE